VVTWARFPFAAFFPEPTGEPCRFFLSDSQDIDMAESSFSTGARNLFEAALRVVRGELRFLGEESLAYFCGGELGEPTGESPLADSGRRGRIISSVGGLTGRGAS
jgi:hypothetical protein